MKSVSAIKSNNNNVVLLYCVSLYPPKFENVNLNQIEYMRKKFKVQIGFSDHSLGYNAALIANGLGSRVIEKHFTLDKNLTGPDHKASLDPKEFKLMVKHIKEIVQSLGDGIKNVQKYAIIPVGCQGKPNKKYAIIPVSGQRKN